MIRIIGLQQYAPLARRMSRNFGLFKFPLPDLGEKIKEGTVKKLYVREGDRVGEFDKLADVESDKQFTEITAPEEGIIKKLHYKED
jgi:2-oxoisovalerate dehydrogenase E2 component (dihydrolipoyl transacylase)